MDKQKLKNEIEEVQTEEISEASPVDDTVTNNDHVEETVEEAKPVDEPSPKDETETEEAPKAKSADEAVQRPQKKVPAELELRWYVAHTYSGHENKVKINLGKRLRFFGLSKFVEEVFIPTQDKIEVKEGQRKEVTERIFPGYVLVKMYMTDETFSVVKDTPGVTGFVGTANNAMPLSNEEVTAIRQFAEQDTPQYESQFRIGEGVKIIDGPFSDFVGTVDTIDEDKGKMTVLVSIFGRETPVELDFLQVGKL